MFRFKFRKEKQLELDYGAPVVMTDKDIKNPEKVEQYVVERLEQLIELAQEVEEEKAEYRKVTSYLNDIQILENLSAEEKKQLSETAVNVVQLNRARNDFLNSSRKLTDVQFAQMDHAKEDVPDAIKRLSSNEVYRDTLKKDMNYLEREKAEWQLHREYLAQHKKKMHNLLYVSFGMAATAAGVCFLLSIFMKMDLFYAWIILAFLTVLAVCSILIKMQNDDTDTSVAEKNLNRAILLQNKVKIKYVNIANAIDYACEKYHVRNAKELNRTWEAYVEAVREREKYQRTNEDLEYFNGRLVRVLDRFRLYDAQIWVAQVAALVDAKEMVEVKHNYVTQRQKLRDRMKYNLMEIHRLEKEAVEMAVHVPDSNVQPQIQEILQSIHRLGKVI